MIAATERDKAELLPIFTLQNLALLVGIGVMLIILYAQISGFYIKRQPWMNTVTLPLNQKTIAIVEVNQGQKWVLAPLDCVGTDRHLLPGCEDQVIELPILP